MKTLVAAVLMAVLTVGGARVSAQATPTGAAHDVGEAPGARPLAPLPADEDPAHERSMAFAAGGSQCRETVPGGTLLAVAYAVVIVVLGAYVGWLARKNAQLTASLGELEREVARRRERAVTPGGDANG